MKAKLIAVTAAMLLMFVGVAQATGVFKHEDPQLDRLQAQAKTLARALERDQGSAGASKARRGKRGRRGPQGRRGPRGARGAQGAQGTQGPAGTFGTVIGVESSPAFLCSFEAGACAVGSARVECPAGTKLTGGGFTGAGILTTVAYSSQSGNGWAVIGINFDEVPVDGLRATAMCAS